MSKRERELPKIGDKIPFNKFFVSKMNVRVDEEFGESPEDVALTRHLTWRDIVQPFIARPEGKGYGVVVGRRRFLAKKKVTKEFVVGQDCLIKEMTDEDALDASLRENLTLFRSNLNPITRAKRLAQLKDSRLVSLRGLARAWRIPVSTLSDWIKPLELNQRMREVAAKDLIHFTDTLQVAKLELGNERQDELAELVEKKGYDAFKGELTRLRAGKGKRGIQADRFLLIRALYDKRYPPDVEQYETLKKVAEEKNMDIDKLVKKVIIPDWLKEHVKAKI